MTMDEANRIFRFWEKAPPTFRLMAGFVGFKSKASQSQVVEGVSFEKVRAETQDWFENPEQFFTKH